MDRVDIPRLMIAGTSSGSGKTTVVCGILKVLKERGLNIASFKCGPDYIDPMFHREVLKIASRNLDLFFAGRDKTLYLLEKNGRGKDIAIMEGVMGYYDGAGVDSHVAGSYDLARSTSTPTILVVDGRGMSLSILAEIKGFLEFKDDSKIKGVILNRTSKGVFEILKHKIEDELGIAALGYLPKIEGASFESRHLGLITADEVEDMEEKLENIAKKIREGIDLDRLLKIAESAASIEYEGFDLEALKRSMDGIDREKLKIAVALDKAFCFYYDDNLDLLRELGAEICFFSPLLDQEIPEGCSGMMIGGGYPELFGDKLEEARNTTNSIKNVIEAGMPTIAECGGFMYLHDEIEQKDGRFCSGVGVLQGERAFATNSLGRFGYINVRTKEDSLLGKKNTTFAAHEFHYWDSTSPGSDCVAEKPSRKRGWECIVSRENLFCGFPHIYYYSNPETAKEFLLQCAAWKKRKRHGI